MKNTPSARKACESAARLCEGTPYLFRFRADGDWLGAQLTTRREAPEYTPDLYFDPDWNATDEVCVRVQTTSYGALNISEIARVAAGLTEAARLAEQLGNVFAAEGFEVHGR